MTPSAVSGCSSHAEALAWGGRFAETYTIAAQAAAVARDARLIGQFAEAAVFAVGPWIPTGSTRVTALELALEALDRVPATMSDFGFASPKRQLGHCRRRSNLRSTRYVNGSSWSWLRLPSVTLRERRGRRALLGMRSADVGPSRVREPARRSESHGRRRSGRHDDRARRRVLRRGDAWPSTCSRLAPQPTPTKRSTTFTNWPSSTEPDSTCGGRLAWRCAVPRLWATTPRSNDSPRLAAAVADAVDAAVRTRIEQIYAFVELFLSGAYEVLADTLRHLDGIETAFVPSFRIAALAIDGLLGRQHPLATVREAIDAIAFPGPGLAARLAMGTLAAHAVQEPGVDELAAWMAAELSPFAGCLCIVDGATFGPIDHYVADLATFQGHLDDSRRFRNSAIALATAAAPRWKEHP